MDHATAGYLLSRDVLLLETAVPGGFSDLPRFMSIMVASDSLHNTCLKTKIPAWWSRFLLSPY